MSEKFPTTWVGADVPHQLFGLSGIQSTQSGDQQQEIYNILVVLGINSVSWNKFSFPGIVVTRRMS